MRFIFTVILLFAVFLPSLSTNAQAQAGPFEMMEAVFEGNYSEAEIRRTVDKIDDLYTFKKTGDEKYKAIGSVAVELAKEEPFTEMELLFCTIEAKNELVTEFPDVAGLCATQLSNQ